MQIEEETMNRSATFFARAAFALAAVFTHSSAIAQTYPSRAVELVVAYAPGGTGDVVARLLANKLSVALGQSVVVENRAGASGAIGAQYVARAKPDGHTLLAGQTAEVAINQSLVKDLAYDPDRDLLPVALAAVVPLALVVPGNAPYSTVKEMVQYARSWPQGLSFASAGTGTPGHFAREVLKRRTQSNFVHVSYKGAGPALNDLVGGHVDFYFSGYPAAAPQIKAGRLKVLALSSAKRSQAAPGVPPVAEAEDIKGFDFTLWVGIFAPRGTPRDVVLKLNREINQALAQPELRDRLAGEGAEVATLTVEQVTEFVNAESEKYRQIIKETGIKSE
jgi:tripartite-type tricarboxylate transporter receptor subunit TctC